MGMLPNKFRVMVTLEERQGGWERDGERTVLDAFTMLDFKRSNKNDLKQENRRLIFIKSKEVDMWVPVMFISCMLKIFTNSGIEGYVSAIRRPGLLLVSTKHRYMLSAKSLSIFQCQFHYL